MKNILFMLLVAIPMYAATSFVHAEGYASSVDKAVEKAHRILQVDCGGGSGSLSNEQVVSVRQGYAKFYTVEMTATCTID